MNNGKSDETALLAGCKGVSICRHFVDFVGNSNAIPPWMAGFFQDVIYFFWKQRGETVGFLPTMHFLPHLVTFTDPALMNVLLLRRSPRSM